MLKENTSQFKIPSIPSTAKIHIFKRSYKHINLIIGGFYYD